MSVRFSPGRRIYQHVSTVDTHHSACPCTRTSLQLLALATIRDGYRSCDLPIRVRAERHCGAACLVAEICGNACIHDRSVSQVLHLEGLRRCVTLRARRIADRRDSELVECVGVAPHARDG